jgi:hypothetical protein
MNEGERRKAEVTSTRFAPRVAGAIARQDPDEIASSLSADPAWPLAETLLRDAKRAIDAVALRRTGRPQSCRSRESGLRQSLHREGICIELRRHRRIGRALETPASAYDPVTLRHLWRSRGRRQECVCYPV